MLVEFPEYFHELAFDIGKARSHISRKVYKKGTKKYRGKREEQISTLGVLGELIMRHVFYIEKVSNAFNPIIDLDPIVDWDCMTDKGRYDIKTVRQNDKYLNINKEAHENPVKTRHITHYLFVILKSRTTAQIKSFTIDEVWDWEIYKSTFSKVYRNKI